jgi:hypothetical protein
VTLTGTGSGQADNGYIAAALPIGRHPARERINAFMLESHSALIGQGARQEHAQKLLALPSCTALQVHQALQVLHIAAS